MIKTFVTWLKKPYYINFSNTFNLKLSIGIGFFVFIFLSFFQLEHIEVLSINPHLFRASVSIITICNLLFFFFVITKIFSNFFNEEKWTVYKHFMTIFFLIFTSSILRWAFINYVLVDEKNATLLDLNFFKIIKYSFGVGVIPVLIYIYFDEKYHYNKYKKSSENFMKNRKQTDDPLKKGKKVTIFDVGNKNSISFKLNNLVYVTTESNYACFFIKDKRDLKEHILRLPLKAVEERLKEYNNIVRCHRSYIVNTDAINNISGNARGHYLNVNGSLLDIPVSREISKVHIEKVNS